jgi:glycine oxidase
MTSVAIVGGGVIGLFCAATLARRGARVTLFEAMKEDFDVHGPAASLAAAGMLAPISEALREEQAHAALEALRLASFDLWRAQGADAIWADGVRFSGAAVLAKDEAGAAEVLAKVAALGRRAAPMKPGDWWKRAGLDARAPHAVFVEDEGVADPPRVLSGLAMEARRCGATLLFSHDAVELGAGFVRSYEGERAEADHIVVAPGAWASKALAAAAPALERIRPAKGHMIPVAVEGELIANVRAPDFYLARRGEGDVVLGGDMKFGDYNRRAEPERVAALFAAAERALPGLVRAHGEAPPWAGVRPMSPDGAPLIGPSGAAGVLVAAGHSRNGWLLAPITAEIVSAYVFGDEAAPEWAAFSPTRFDRV